MISRWMGVLAVAGITAANMSAQRADWVTCLPEPQLPRPQVTTNEMIVPEAWRPKHQGWNLDANHNYIEDSLEMLSPNSVADVTVALNHATTEDDVRWLEGLGAIRYASRSVPAVFLGGVRLIDLPQIAADPRVAHIEKRRTYYWQTDRSIQNIRVAASTTYPAATFADACPGIDGSGINIAILDSGVDDPSGPGVTHVGLPAAVYAYDAVADTLTNPNDDVGHGTHVAQIALGRPNIGFRGVAPGAGLIDMRVGGAAGPDDAAISRAIDKCKEKQTEWGCRIMNMSFGDCSISSDGTLVGDAQVNSAVAAGIVVAVAMGNAASNGCPAAGTQRVGTPAAADKAVTVQLSSYAGTVTRTDDTIGTPLHLRGPRNTDGDADTLDEFKPDVTAPGMATVSPNTGIASAKWNTPGLATTDYFRAFGTSMASPHVAGLAALILHVNPSLSADAVKQIILTSAENRGTGVGWKPDWGHGLIDGLLACQTTKAPTTNLKFNTNCASPTPSSWSSPDVYPGSPIITEGVANTLNAVVTNAGSNPAASFQVELGVHDTSNSTAPYATVCTVNVPSLAAGATTTISCPWTPNVALATGEAHACLKARIVYHRDSDASDDCAQRNVQIVATMSPARFRFAVVNPTLEDLAITFRSDQNLCNVDGWNLRLPDSFTLRQGEAPRITEVLLDPGTSTGAKVVHVETVGTAGDGRRLSLGGVTFVAQTPQIRDCNRNGVDDDAEISLQITPDLNRNGVPDNCEANSSRRRAVRK